MKREHVVVLLMLGLGAACGARAQVAVANATTRRPQRGGGIFSGIGDQRGAI